MDRIPLRNVGVVLAARSAVAAVPTQEVQALADRALAIPGVSRAAFGFSEMGSPTLCDALTALASEPLQHIVIVPLLLPMEPSFRVWLLRAVSRWRKPGWPAIHVAPAPIDAMPLEGLVATMVEQGLATRPLAQPARVKPKGSVVPAQKYRALFCFGGPCNNAGASAIWVHFREQQEKQRLRTAGDGTMSCKTTCLGPCELAPVVEVTPDGTYYGGVTEEAVDRIIVEHLLGGKVVSDFAYPPNGKKQVLRNPDITPPDAMAAKARGTES
jgi:(2Fe-2S) ferredoxin